MNTLSIFNPLDSFESIFDDFFAPSVSFTPVAAKNFRTPSVDVKKDENAYTLEMELPGKTEKDVNIELDNNVLTVSSKEESEKTEKDDSKWIVRERVTSSFERRFTLPEDVNENDINASFKNGILTISLPRKELPSPKRIAISAA